MVTRKSNYFETKEKKQAEGPQGKKPPNVKLTELEDPMKDGIWTAGVGSEIIVERPFGGKRQKSLCVVRKVEPSLVETWDETLNRWFSFDPAELAKGGVITRLLKRQG